MQIERFGAEPVVDEAAVEAEIDGFVRGWQPAPGDPVREPWKITSLGAAGWAMDKVAEVHALVAQYDEEIKRWQAARANVAKAGQWLEARLQEWAIASRTKSAKTFVLARGQVSTRETRTTAIVVDEAAALEWAEGHDQAAVKRTSEFLPSKSTAHIEECAMFFTVTDPETGDMHDLPVDPDVPLFGGELAAALVELRRSGRVDVTTELRVITHDGRYYPGLAVKHGKISASVQASGVPGF